MMNHFIYNGKFFPEDTPVFGADSRGFKFGDGLFETMKCVNSNIILLDEHIERLWHGMYILKFDLPKHFTTSYLKDQLDSLLKKNKQVNARIRLTIIRGKGGIFDPENLYPNYIIQSWLLATNTSTLNVNGLQLCIYREALKSIDSFSNVKHNNFLPYSMAALYAKSMQCNDAVILNSEHRICETSIANIFMIKNGIVTTPPLSEGCIAGVMRHFIIKQLKNINVVCIEKDFLQADLMEADEVFVSNSMYNIRWVAAIGDIEFSNQLTSQIFARLQKTNPDVIC